MHADVHPFLHAPTSTWSYVVSDRDSRAAAVIDPVLDFDIHSGLCWTGAADEIVAHVRRERLTVEWILETHAHADHLSAAPHIKASVGGRMAIGEGICQVQRTFRELLNLGSAFPVDGRQFDRLFADGEEFRIGSLMLRAIATPGHTSDSLSYLIGDAVFVGDSIFMPDGGTARCDFPGGDATVLHASIRRLYELPPETRVFVCHDYSPGGREPRCETTIAAERAGNIHLRDGVTEAEFVAMRTKRDAGLTVPKLLYPSVQTNIRAGQLPEPEANGRRYMKLPLTCPAA
ncbi:MAG: fold metallo-hydrolase [Steroidobacteraceae bacterium]|nr:fold metallo-hydrolase [Steroidobacteraceae bacterium]MBM2853340.1 fold metallo-hydrolase [Steroidobacteraceae bacterium]